MSSPQKSVLLLRLSEPNRDSNRSKRLHEWWADDSTCRHPWQGQSMRTHPSSCQWTPSSASWCSHTSPRQTQRDHQPQPGSSLRRTSLTFFWSIARTFTLLLAATTRVRKDSCACAPATRLRFGSIGLLLQKKQKTIILHVRAQACFIPGPLQRNTRRVLAAHTSRRGFAELQR